MFVKTVADGEAPPVGTVLWAKRTMGYGGQELDRGQVFAAKGLLNDSALLRLGYIALVQEGQTTYACRVCGAEFVDQMMRDGHGKKQHEQRVFVPPPAPTKQSGESEDSFRNRLDDWSRRAGAMADAKDESSDKIENDVAPLDLTKTTASRT